MTRRSLFRSLIIGPVAALMGQEAPSKGHFSKLAADVRLLIIQDQMEEFWNRQVLDQMEKNIKFYQLLEDEEPFPAR